MIGSVARRLSACLDTEEVRAVLDEALPEPATSWSVLFPGEEGFSVFAGGPGTHAGPADAELASTLERWWERDERLVPVEGDVRVTADQPRVRAVSPLTFRDEKYGLFLVHGEAGVDLDWWQEVVDVLGAGLVRAQLYESANHESASSGTKLDALNEAGKLVRHVDLQVLLTKLMELSIRIMHAQVGAIVLLEDGELETGIEWGLRDEVLFALRTPEGRPFLKEHVERGEPILVEDAATSDAIDVSGLQVNIQSLVAVPLVAQGRPLGAIVIVNSGDGSLSRQDADVLATIANMSAAAVENAMLYVRTREHERIAHEMKLASDIQKALLPKEHPSSSHLETAGWCMSASETGGDFYDFPSMGEGRTGIVIGDATGHGMGAALIVFIARSTLKALLDGEDDLEKVLTRMNDLVEQELDDDRFMTLYFGVYHEESRKLVYTSAGHDPPLIYRPSTDEFFEQIATGAPLGILPGMDFPTEELELRPGDFLVLGTDGIWEARNPEGEFYGKERLREIVREVHGQPVEEASERIRQHILDFHQGAEQNDDITAVFVRMK